MKVIEFGAGNKGPATLFLHGFPGVRSKQNQDLARSVAERTGRRSFVPLYNGLGQADGEFSFLECKSQVELFAQALIDKNGTIDIVGHSWGGYLALDLAAEHQEKVKTLVLMSPLIYFYTLDLTQQAFRLTQDGNADLKLGVTDERAKEFFELGNREKADDFAKHVSTHTKVSIFQAENDDTTPTSYAENLVNQFKSRPYFEKVRTDHSFLLDRELALERVMSAL